MKATQYMMLDTIPRGLDRLLYVTLQGLVNRPRPRLYLNAVPDTDGHWVDWYGGYGLEPEPVTLGETLHRLLPETRGAYRLGDQDADWEVPLAVTLAGLDDRVLVTPEQVATVEAAGGRVEPLPVPRFHTRLEAMAWAVSNLRPRTSPDLLHANSWPKERFSVDIADWVVAHRGFSYRLTCNPVSRPGERALLGELYNGSPLYTHVLGWHNRDDGECAHVQYASEYGMIPFCMTRNLNFSFHRHVAAQGEYRQHPAPEPPALERDVCYLTFVFSDGDAPHSMGDLQKRQWTQPRQGEFPFGWAIPPLQPVFGPAMLEYYYRTLPPGDELLCGPSGLGYNYLSRWAVLRDDVADPADARAAYLERTDACMRRLDLRAMWPINRLLEWLPDGRLIRRLAGNDVWVLHADNEPGMYGIDFMDDGVIRDYCRQVKAAAGFFQGWHNIPRERERIFDGRPWFPGKVLAERPEQTVRDIKRCHAIEETAPAFIPVHVNCYAMGMEGVAETISQLDLARYRVLSPTAFLRLAPRRQ